jgi:trigger factor
MEVSVETTESLERRMTVAIPAENVETEVSKRLNDLRGKVKMNGFRPGKVPLSVVKSQFGGQVMQEVVSELVSSSYGEAITEQKLRPAGSPSIEPRTMPPEGPLEYIATFEVYPEVTLSPAGELQITRVSADIVDADIDKVIEKLREQQIEWHEVDRAAAEGDKVVIDFEGKLENGNEFSGNSATDAEIVLGEGRLIKGFEEQLQGASSGDNKTVTVTFPDDYASKELAGQTANFDVSVKAVKGSQLPEINEEFIKAYGVEDGSEASFRRQVGERLEKERDDAARGKTKGAVMDALLAANTLELPKSLLTSEIQGLKQRMMENIQGGGSSALGDLPDDIFKDDASRRVSLGLLLSEIVKQHDIQADGEAVRAYIEKAAADYEHPEQVVNWYYEDDSRLTEVEMVVIEDKVVDWVLDNAKVTDKSISFDELVSKGDGTTAV